MMRGSHIHLEWLADHKDRGNYQYRTWLLPQHGNPKKKTAHLVVRILSYDEFCRIFFLTLGDILCGSVMIE